MRRAAFTLLELIFVIVIMGILAKFGIELLSQAYKSFIFSSINNRLQSQSAAAVETIASRLQYRIKDSIIARKTAADYKALASSDYGDAATILEWVATDIDGFRGNSAVMPHWSGIIDIDLSSSSVLISPRTNTGELNTLISTLSNSNSGIDNAAIYFVGSDSDIFTGYGWGGAITTQDVAMHPIRRSATAGEENLLIPTNGATGADNNLSGVNVYEYYQLAWTAYAVVHTPADGNLTLYYDYQPWEGQSYTDGASATLMEDVDTFRFKAAGSIVKIQVCVRTDLMEDYSLCKEKTVF